MKVTEHARPRVCSESEKIQDSQHFHTAPRFFFTHVRQDIESKQTSDDSDRIQIILSSHLIRSRAVVYRIAKTKHNNRI